MFNKRDDKIVRNKDFEGPIETGQTYGMNPVEVVDRYLNKPNYLLRLLRIYHRKSIEEISSFLGVSSDELLVMEDSNELIPFQLVPKIAKMFDIDLKKLLLLLGHVIESDEQKKDGNSSTFAMAAQYAGPELTKQQKLDLEDLFRTIASRANNV